MHARVPRSAPAILIAAGMMTLAFTGGAVAAGLITGADIKDGTVASVDVKDGTLKKRDLSDTTVADLQGSIGPQGPQGPPGPSAAYRTSSPDTTLPSGGGWVSLGSLTLPAGDYVVTGTFQLSNETANPQPVNCRITVGSEASDPYSATLERLALDSLHNLPVTLTRAGSLAGESTATVSCQDNAGPDTGQAEVRRIHLWAIQVGSLVTQ